jgi:hypothetical protein
MEFARDGKAVASARKTLVQQGVSGEQGWRSTVVPNERGGWIVRTWVRTPPEASRPSGAPDYVHDVNEDGVAGFDVQQVHP